MQSPASEELGHWLGNISLGIAVCIILKWNSILLRAHINFSFSFITREWLRWRTVVRRWCCHTPLFVSHHVSLFGCSMLR